MATKLVIELLDKAKGDAEDNLLRAKHAFRGRTSEQMNQRYGQSNDTCQEILDGYQKRYDEIVAEIANQENS